MLTDPVLCELERECTKDSRGDRPMIDAPHALLSRKDRGNRIACCQRSGLPCVSAPSVELIQLDTLKKVCWFHWPICVLVCCVVLGLEEEGISFFNQNTQL